MKQYLGIFLLVISLSACGFNLSGAVQPCNITIKADALEPNDTSEQATPLSATKLAATFKESDKPDFFRMTGNAGDTISLEKKSGLGELIVSVKNAEGKDLEVKQTSATVQSVTLSANGAYLIQVGLKTTNKACPNDVEYDLSSTPATVLTPSPTPTPTPIDSALGDSPTLTGTFKNLADLGAHSGTLKLTATVYTGPDSFTKIAEGMVAENGTFSITLPGKSVLDALVTVNPYLYNCPPPALTPDTTKGTILALTLSDDTQEVADVVVLALTDQNDPNSDVQASVSYSYLDTNSSYTGTLPQECGGFVRTGGDLPADITLQAGWNSLLIDKTQGLLNKKPDSSFEWFALPKLVNPNPNNFVIDGTVQDYTKGETSLEVYLDALNGGTPTIISTGGLNADGSFSVALPETLGEELLTPNVTLCEGVTATPSSFNTASVRLLRVIKDGAGIGSLLRESLDVNDPTTGKRVIYAYVDQDVQITGTCSDSNVSYNLSLQQGWNVVVQDTGDDSLSFTTPESVDLPWVFRD